LLCILGDKDKESTLTMAPLRNILPFHKRDVEGSTPPSVPTTASIEPKEGVENVPQNENDYRPQSEHSRRPQSGHSRRHHHHHHRDHARARKNALSQWMSNKWRNEFVAALAEFAGTFMFLCTFAIMQLFRMHCRLYIMHLGVDANLTFQSLHSVAHKSPTRQLYILMLL
jgi:hypothetical protein